MIKVLWALHVGECVRGYKHAFFYLSRNKRSLLPAFSKQPTLT